MLSLTHATHISTMSKIVTPVTTLNILPVTVTTAWIHVASNLCLVSSFHLHVITWEQLATFSLFPLLQVCEALPGVPTPPQSPPDFTPSPASTNESCSPQQQFPNPTGEQLNGLEGRGVEKESASSLAPPVTSMCV